MRPVRHELGADLAIGRPSIRRMDEVMAWLQGQADGMVAMTYDHT